MTINIRKATPEDVTGIATVHVISWQTAYRGLMSDEVLDNLSVEQRAGYWLGVLSDKKNPSFVFVAENESGILGFVCAGPARERDPRYESEVMAIYLHPSVRGQGIGRRLMQAAASELLAHDFRTMLLWVLRDNKPSRSFYEALGGKYLREKTIEIAGQTLIEVAYGYGDLTRLT